MAGKQSVAVMARMEGRNKGLVRLASSVVGRVHPAVPVRASEEEQTEQTAARGDDLPGLCTIWRVAVH